MGKTGISKKLSRFYDKLREECEIQYFHRSSTYL